MKISLDWVNQNMHLITTLSKSNSEERNNEYLTCLKNNNQNKYIKSITVLSEDKNVQTLTNNISKVKLITTDSRPTFRIIVDYINNNFSIGDIIIISNSDIYYDDSLKHVKFDKNYAYCLTRWHKNSTKDNWYHGVFPASHDTWILKVPIVVDNVDFYIGILGCDSRFSYQLFETDYLPINPSYLIKCYHLHCSNIRTWKCEDILCGDYLGIKPCNEIKYISNRLFKYSGIRENGEYHQTKHIYNFSK
jgi:hypothetical protein